MHLFRPRELVKGTNTKAAPERGTKNQTVFEKTGADKATPNGVFYFIVSKNAMHQKYFETINETIPKIHDFILEFHNTTF
jgi:hypothetical protein